MRPCTGFWPSPTRGSARPLTVAIAYWRYCVEAYLPSGRLSPSSPESGAKCGGNPPVPPPAACFGAFASFTACLAAAPMPSKRSF